MMLDGWQQWRLGRRLKIGFRKIWRWRSPSKIQHHNPTPQPESRDRAPTIPSPAKPTGLLDDEALHRDILANRPFSLAEAIGREGGDFFKGISPVPPLAQAIAIVNRFIDQHVADSSGALKTTLQRWATTDVRLSQRLHQSSFAEGELPLMVLRQIILELLDTPPIFYEFVRQVDVCWGQLYGEPPHFQAPGEPPHPDDEYTHASVHRALSDCLVHLQRYKSV